MKVIILAGGYGTRLSEETHSKPKAMVEIGGYPILWHIMKMYSHYGINDFIICLGYKGYVIKEYFANYFLYQSDVTFDMTTNKMEVHNKYCEPWRVTLVNTGLNTMTGGRIKRIQEYLGNETFMLTYGDGVGDININALLEFHKKNKKYATITAVQPTARFGALNINENNDVESFVEKPLEDANWINAGFFVLEPEIFNYITDDSTVWEKGPLENLTKDKKLCAYKHNGFWMPMDSLKDKNSLQKIWDDGNIPWKLWK